jgi:L-cystine transport system permease protein
MLNFNILYPDFLSIVTAVPGTLFRAVIIFILSTIIGGLFAMVEYRRIPVLRQSVIVYKIAFKGMPMVIVIFLAYYGLPMAINTLSDLMGANINGHLLPNIVTLIIALTACVSAFQAEVWKGALNSFDHGQADAAASLGYTNRQMFRRVMFPQIIVAAIPDFANSFMVIMKALSLGFAIVVVDIFAQAQLTAALNYYFLEAFLVAVVIYMVIAYLVTLIADRTEKALRV